MEGLRPRKPSISNRIFSDANRLAVLEDISLPALKRWILKNVKLVPSAVKLTFTAGEKRRSGVSAK